ncbi:MAG: TIGR02646 family protein [Planctomycetaceae bacterium]|nr:TIGR02646 family protein [Planctomycetaceae bacterium]
MRKQQRPPIPAVLEEHSEKWNKQWKQRKQENPSATFQWYQHQGRAARDWILADLREMTQGHCAFCDGFPLENTSGEPVEHFRPKSDERFFHLAYSWENLFYCCEACQKCKREQWDDDLLKPDAVDYEFETYFQFDFTTGAIEPNRFSTPDAQRRASVTIAMYGLDSEVRQRHRRLELRKWQKCGTDEDLNDFAYRDFLHAG